MRACLFAGLIAAFAATPAIAARVLSKATSHLAFTATIPDAIARGGRASLVFDVVPKKGIHIYAPGTKYQAIAIALEPQPALKVHDTIYPPPATYRFKPLNEEVLVYQAPFRLTIDVTATNTAAQRLTLKGQLTYQACDETACYFPSTVPFAVTIRVTMPPP